jgi:YfiH family protein
VADCAPLLLASADGRVVAAVHAGWRGVLAGVVPGAVRELRRVCSAAGQAPARILAAIGPCIGPEAFEVGQEVVEQFQARFGQRVPVDRNTASGKGHVDLRAAIRIQLLDAGVNDDCIDSSDLCTYRDAEQFFSHRRDRGITGRMAGLISPRHDA